MEIRKQEYRVYDLKQLFVTRTCCGLANNEQWSIGEAITTSSREVIEQSGRSAAQKQSVPLMRGEFTKEVHSLTEFYNLIEAIWIYETHLHYFEEISSETPWNNKWTVTVPRSVCVMCFV